LFFIILSAGCTPTGNTLSDTGAAGKNILKVGVTSNAPPLIYKHNNQFTGLEAELARELAKFTGKEVRFVEVKWVDQIPALLSGKTDIIMSGMTVTTLREMRITFSRPYIIAGQVSLVRRNEYNRYSNGLTDLLNPTNKIGTVTGTTGDFLIQDKVARGSTQFKTPAQGVDALIDKKIDVFVYDLPMNFYFASLNETKGIVPVPVPLSREHLAWGIRKEDTELLNSANNLIEHLRQNNQLQTIVQRWIPFYKNIYNQ
jgi:polar amino acid transport system substrate-binding protein